MYANIIGTCALIVAILSIPGFIKHFHGIGLKQLKANPNSKILFIAVGCTILFYSIPFPEIHFGRPVVKEKIVKIHDTVYDMVYKHDTIYIKGNKNFNNKIEKVDKLNQY